MKIEIKHRYTGAVLFVVEAESWRVAVELAVKGGANLRGADLGGAYLGGADLRGAYLGDANLRDANLRDANLRGAYLGDANLRDANLRDANLRGADLGGAYLGGAEGINKYLTSPLYLLLDQVGPIRAYKLVTSDYRSPIYASTPLTYEVGATVEAPSCNADENELCGEGLHVATMDWCLKERQEGWKLLLVEFDREDLVCIPLGTDGKFRVKKLRVVKELDWADYGVEEEGE